MKRANWKPHPGRGSPRRGVLGAGRRGRRASSGSRRPVRPAFPTARTCSRFRPSMLLDESQVDVLENGELVEQLSVVPADEAAEGEFGIVLVIDASNSMQGAADRRRGGGRARLRGAAEPESARRDRGLQQRFERPAPVHRRPGGDRSRARSAPGAGVRDACLRRCRRGARPAARGRDRSRLGRRPLGRLGHGERRLEPGGGRAGGGGGSPRLLRRASLEGLRLRRARAAGDRRRRHVLRGSVLRRARARLRRARSEAGERVSPPLPLGVTARPRGPRGRAGDGRGRCRHERLHEPRARRHAEFAVPPVPGRAVLALARWDAARGGGLRADHRPGADHASAAAPANAAAAHG